MATLQIGAEAASKGDVLVGIRTTSEHPELIVLLTQKGDSVAAFDMPNLISGGETGIECNRERLEGIRP